MKKITTLRTIIYLLILGIVTTLFYLVPIKSGLQSCDWIDAFLGFSGCTRRIEFENDSAKGMFFTPNSETLIILSVRNAIQIRRTSNGELLHTIEGETSGTANNIALSSDGTVLAIVFYRKIELWQVSDGTLLSVLQGNARFSETTFTSDFSTLATGTSGTIELWQINDQVIDPLHTLEGHTDQVWEMAFSPDGSIFASGSYDGTVRLWDVGDGSPLYEWDGQMGVIQSLAFSPDGSVVAAGGDRTIRLWNIGDGSLLHILVGHKGNMFNPGYLLDLSFSPDGNYLASAGKDKAVRIWRVSDGMLLQTIKHGNEVWSVAFSPDGTMFASAEFDGPVRIFDVRQWNLDQP